jgi:hypothetical protein
MTMEFCRFRDFAVPLLGLSTRHPSIHEMRATQLVDSSFRAPHLPDAAGTRLCLGRMILRSIRDKRSQFFTGTHNETLSVTAMCVSKSRLSTLKEILPRLLNFLEISSQPGDILARLSSRIDYAAWGLSGNFVTACMSFCSTGMLGRCPKCDGAERHCQRRGRLVLVRAGRTRSSDGYEKITKRR